MENIQKKKTGPKTGGWKWNSQRYHLSTFNTDSSKGELGWIDHGLFPTYESMTRQCKEVYPDIDNSKLKFLLHGRGLTKYQLIKIKYAD